MYLAYNSTVVKSELKKRLIRFTRLYDTGLGDANQQKKTVKIFQLSTYGLKYKYMVIDEYSLKISVKIL